MVAPSRVVWAISATGRGSECCSSTTSSTRPSGRPASAASDVAFSRASIIAAARASLLASRGCSAVRLTCRISSPSVVRAARSVSMVSTPDSPSSVTDSSCVAWYPVITAWLSRWS